MIDDKTYRWLYFLIAITYLTGLFIAPLMENDAIEYATISMRMFLEGDFANIINRFTDYLDKPHLLYWLGGLSFKLFGISDWAYRLPSVIATFLGAFATFRLGARLYNKEIGKLAALIFLTNQATILGNHDVRTDALLTGTVIIGIWQIVEFIHSNKIKHIIFGSIALAMGFSTKGQMAILTAGIVLLCHIFYLRKWDTFLNWKWLVGLTAFLVACSPMLYNYYYQFDLHPEKLVNGQYNVSAIKFIFWDQSFERFVGDRSFEANPGYFFLHHSFLWAFLPWSAIAIGAIIHKTKDLIITKFRWSEGKEFMTLGGPILVLSIISFSSFKLPHYINILFPLFSILTAYYLIRINENKNKIEIKGYMIIQYVIGAALFVLLIFLNLWAFPISQWYWAVLYLLFSVLVIYVYIRVTNIKRKIIITSVVMITFANFILHTNYYPKLMKYQSGSELAYLAKDENIPLKDIYYFEKFSRSFEFYSRVFLPEITLKELEQKEKGTKKWVFTYQKGLETLKAANIEWDRMIKVEHFRITMVTPKFLNPATRKQAISHAYLLKIK